MPRKKSLLKNSDSFAKSDSLENTIGKRKSVGSKKNSVSFNIPPVGNAKEVGKREVSTPSDKGDH